jgi:hypothetical protein
MNLLAAAPADSVRAAAAGGPARGDAAQPQRGADLPAGLAVRLLEGWQNNARTALQWLHRDWLMAALGWAPGIVPGTAAGRAAQTALASVAPDVLDVNATRAAHGLHGAAVGSPYGQANGQPFGEPSETALAALLSRCDAACSLAVLRVLLPAPPSLEILCTVPAARLDALPVETGLRVLRMQALLARRSEMRRLIDRATRMRLAGWIGCKLDELLAVAAPEPQTLADTQRARAAARPLALLSADELAFEGLALLPRGGGTAPATTTATAAATATAATQATPPCPLLRLALPRSAAAQPAVNAPSDAECDDTFALLSLSIATFLPEYAW